MPKETFFNLSEEKRRKIEDIALDEFAEYGLEGASINRIVAAAEIAKGSFYQYFNDKLDLYSHIIARIGELKLAYISPVMQNPEGHDFFVFLEEIYKSGIAFAKDHPKESVIGFEIYNNQSNPVFEEIMLENRQEGLDFYEFLIDKGIERGEIDPKIDKAFTSHILMQMQFSMLDYFLENNDEETWVDELMPTVTLMLNFIKNGIQSQRKGVLSQ